MITAGVQAMSWAESLVACLWRTAVSEQIWDDFRQRSWSALVKSVTWLGTTFVKRSANLSTAAPKRPVGETIELSKMVLISGKLSHKWRYSTTGLAIERPIVWAAILVVHSVKSVALRSCLNMAGS